ncbi:MAG TPA: hypothetical protein VMN39_12830 [Longimicrobiaceae bacterium]|nr:hypothetical protein [Longimicrobiaceae bacterium]
MPRFDALLIFLGWGVELVGASGRILPGRSGRSRLGEGALALDYFGSYLSHELQRRPHARDLEFDWGERRASAGLAATARGGRGGAAVVAGGGFTAAYATRGGWRQRITYNLEYLVESDDAIRRSRMRIPEQRLVLTTSFAPVERFSLFARFDYRSGTTWPGFRTVDA